MDHEPLPIIPRDCCCDYLNGPLEFTPLGAAMPRRRYRQPRQGCTALHDLWDVIVERLPIFDGK